MAEDNDELKDLGIPLKELIKELEKLHDIVYASIKGLSVTQALPNAIQVLSRVSDEEKKEEYEGSLDEVTRIAAIAKTEIETGFPFLYSHATLMMYAHLEGSIKRFIIGYFRKSKSLLDIKEVAGLKVNFIEFQGMDETDRFDYLFSLYEKNTSMGMAYGVTRFESLLAPIGFSGKVKEGTRKSIHELSQLRNNILHRGGISDKHLIKSCPHLNLSLGDKVSITREQYQRFNKAITDYVLTMAIRLGERRGKNMDEFKVEED